MPELFTMAPEMALLAVLEPTRLSVLLPAPVAVKLDVNVREPAPEASSVAPPVVPARLTTRFVLELPLPVYWSVPPTVVAPMAMVPFAAVVGAPSAEAVLRLASVFTLTVPELMVVVPV